LVISTTSNMHGTNIKLQFKETVTPYSEDHMKHKTGINSGRNALHFNVKAGFIRMCNYGSAFKC
jgi:hypothetical protein